MDVAIAVVSFRTPHYLEQCLASIARHAAHADVVVVDNASGDGSAELVRERFGDARLIANESNVGYGPAANQAVRSCAAEYVLILNADTELEAGAIEALCEHMDAHPRAAVAGPLLLDEAGPQVSTFSFPDSLDWLLENEPVVSVYRRLPPAIRRRGVALRTGGEPRRVPWVLGAALLVRRSAFEDVGGFEESFFMYYEEVDLCRRLERAGWETHYVPTARIRHEGGVATRQVRSPMLVRHFDSALLYYRRHASPPAYTFWAAAMRLKGLALLARDAAKLVAQREPVERARLREQVAGWTARLVPRSARSGPPAEEISRPPHGAPTTGGRRVDADIH